MVSNCILMDLRWRRSEHLWTCLECNDNNIKWTIVIVIKIFPSKCHQVWMLIVQKYAGWKPAGYVFLQEPTHLILGLQAFTLHYIQDALFISSGRKESCSDTAECSGLSKWEWSTRILRMHTKLIRSAMVWFCSRILLSSTKWVAKSSSGCFIIKAYKGSKVNTQKKHTLTGANMKDKGIYRKTSSAMYSLCPRDWRPLRLAFLRPL